MLYNHSYNAYSMSLSAFALKKDGTNLYDKIADTLCLFCRRMDRESFNFCVWKNMENKITTSRGTILPDSFSPQEEEHR